LLFKTGGATLIGGKVGGLPGAVIGGAAVGVKSGADALSPYIVGKWDAPKSEGGTYKSATDYWMGKGHNGGLDYVPYDGYNATLHKGETVLPRGEARDYRKGNAGASGVTINIESMNVRDDSDIDRIGEALFQRINQARTATV
jgi:hypothetical protein